jgi:NADH-quinone oxidoreductase subunit B
MSVDQFLVSGRRPGDDEMTSVSRAFGDSYAMSRLDDAIQWARKYSFFSYPFVTACCGMEYMAVAGPRFDLDRFGAALPRFTPRQADLLMVVGTITHRQMAEPRWVMSFGACTSSGGPYNNYAVVQGIDTIIPVDIYVPGCPPHPQAVLDGLLKLQERVQRERPGTPYEGRHGSGRAL